MSTETTKPLGALLDELREAYLKLGDCAAMVSKNPEKYEDKLMDARIEVHRKERVLLVALIPAHLEADEEVSFGALGALLEDVAKGMRERP